MKLNRNYRSKSESPKKAKKDLDKALNNRKIQALHEILKTFSKNKFGYIVQDWKDSSLNEIKIHTFNEILDIIFRNKFD